VLDASIRASIEFAVLELGVAVVFVLGHESCGAVGATLRFLENGEPLPGELPALVEGVRAHLNPAAPHQDAYASHVRGTIADLLARSAAVRHARDEGDLVVTGGVYALRDGAVGLVDPMA
jgi:carbonic anhydrase